MDATTGGFAAVRRITNAPRITRTLRRASRSGPRASPTKPRVPRTVRTCEPVTRTGNPVASSGNGPAGVRCSSMRKNRPACGAAADRAAGWGVDDAARRPWDPGSWVLGSSM